MAAPSEVFYVVQSSGLLGERRHRVSSVLYETRPQAETELARLSAANPAAGYSVWKGATYLEPPDWLHDVMLFDGTLLPAAGQPPQQAPHRALPPREVIRWRPR